MKAKILYTLITAALVMSAFLIGKSTTSIPNNYIPMETAIPVEDIAEQYIGSDGYLTVELKDLSYQLDNKANASYMDVLKDIPNETEVYKNNMVDMSKIADFSATESGLQLYMSDGSGYYWER